MPVQSFLRARVPAALLISTLGLVLGCSESPTNPGDDPGDPGPSNTAPAAVAGTDQAVSVGYAVQLDGSGSSDADGDAITFAWTLTGPAGSSAALDDATSETPSFTPDVAGAYTLSLVVNDGTDDSAADDATVTAADNSVTVPVAAAAGGSVASSSGDFTLDIPAGALGADTDITVTPLAASQRPAALAGISGDLTVYDLQPSGLTFSAPATLTLEVPSGVTEAAGSVSMSGGLLYSESGGTIETLDNVVFAQDPADPTMATVAGEIDHFSSALFVTASMEFRFDGVPAQVEMGTPVDVAVTADVTGAGIGSIVDMTYTDQSVAPLFASNGLVQGAGSASVTDSITLDCSDSGPARLRGSIFIQTDDSIQSRVTVQLGKDVNCVVPALPLTQTFVSLPRAGRLQPIPGSSTQITVGGGVRVVELTTGTALVDTMMYGADREEWVGRLSDGTFLVHSVLGDVRHIDLTQDPAFGPTVSPYDQARDVKPVAPDVFAVASAFGDLGLIQYQGGGSFTDAFRDLNVLGPQGQDLYLQSIWAGAPGAYTFIGAVTDQGSTADTFKYGDSALWTTRMAILEADVGAGTVTSVPLDGVIDYVVDQDARHVFDTECRVGGPDDLLCVFTAGFESVASNNPFEDRINDGYVAIFTVNLQTKKANTLYWNYGNARVGGAIYDRGGGNLAIAVGNQATERVEVWFLNGSQIDGSWEVDINGCPNIGDFMATGDAEYSVVTCQTPSFSDLAGVTIIQNLQTWLPPTS